MIETTIRYGDEECRVLTDLLLNSQDYRKKLKGWNIFLFIAGLYELIVGIRDLFTSPSWLTPFCLIVAAVAFFLVFGGEKLLYRRAIYKREKKLNEKTVGTDIRMTFSGDENTITSEFGSGTYNWNAFASFGEYSHYLWIRRRDTLCILIDRNRLSEADYAQLKRYCEEKIPQESGK